MADRRRQLGLSTRAAAAAAQIDRTTWATAESGTRLIAVYNRAGVERVLGWEPGSVDAVLAGGEPKLLPKTPAAQTADERLAAEVERIKGLPMSAEARLRMISALVDLYEQQAAERQRSA